jgi:hypothetical protein
MVAILLKHLGFLELIKIMRKTYLYDQNKYEKIELIDLTSIVENVEVCAENDFINEVSLSSHRRVKL